VPPTDDRTTFDVDAFLAATDLNSDHRDVVKRLFAVPPSENIGWRQVRSLLEALGAVTEEHNGKLKVEFGGQVEVLAPPHGKDIDRQMIVDLRGMLSRATDVFVRRVNAP
jgi:gamma-glutamylcysteine synthetase